ncbi:hypothetical protein ACHAQJ_009800 [Trichoderma viride]
MASSSNPFRKTATQHTENRFPPIDSINAAQLFPPPKTSFRDENVPPAAAQSPATDAKKAKVVKKVRVLSPPPRSPDSPEWTASYFTSTAQTYAQEQDPFSNAVGDENNWEDASATPPPQPAVPQPVMASEMHRPVQAVANPFSKKKLQEVDNSKELKEDMREEGEALKAAQSARRSLNVDSFKRLLMTGAASPPNSPPPTDSSSDHDQTDRTKPVRDAPAATIHTNKEKKAPPPPPSSRHGKVIRPGQSVTSSESTISSPKEKPVEQVAYHDEPPRPALSRESSTSSNSSIEDVPVKIETHPPELTSSPDQLDGSILPPSIKKTIPAPPPRRQSRIEVKTNASDSQENEPPPRTSMDSVLSRSGSVRHNANAPAPPPPRRTISSSRQPSTPQSSTFIRPPDFDTPRTSLDSTSRPMAPPPPPPTRNPSTRRPQSLYGLESSQRRAMTENKPRELVAPPPPPSRIRGSSQSSTDGLSGRASLDSARKPRSSADGFGDLGGSQGQYTGQGVDILADLESLQREVDALRGRMS